MRTEYLAWGILGPDGLCTYTAGKRVQAIRQFCANVDRECLAQIQPDDPFWFWSDQPLTAAENRVWRQFKRLGYSAVPVAVTNTGKAALTRLDAAGRESDA